MIRALYLVACATVFVCGDMTGSVDPCATHCACFAAESPNRTTSAICDGNPLTRTFGVMPAVLRELRIRKVKIRHFDFSKMFPSSDFSELRSLTIEDSVMVNVTFRNLSKLEKLQIVRTAVTNFGDAAFSSLGRLSDFELLLSNIRPNNKWFTALTQVETVKFSWIGISGIDENFFSKLTNLKHVVLSGNKLQNVSPSWFGDVAGKLHTLDLSSNNLTLIENDAFHHFVSLQHLNLSRNTIANIRKYYFRNLSQLKYLDISHNNICLEKENVFANLTELQLLNLSTNNIQKLKPELFKGLEKLQVLDVSNNEIRILEQGVFSHMQSLVMLNLASNFLTTLSDENFSGLLKLRTLDVTGNGISEVAPEAFKYLAGLTELVLADNPLLGNLEQELIIVVGTGKRLTTLDASRAGLTQVPPALTHSIRTLRLAGNYISAVHCGDIDSYPLIQNLDLRSNLITEIEEDALGRLELLSELYLSNNNLSNVPFSLPNGLQVLHLDGNQIQEITVGEFQELSSLQNLSLANCQITTIQEGAFSQLFSLQFLDISQNPLKTIERNTLSGPVRLHTLRVSELYNLDANRNSEKSFPIPSLEWIESLDLHESPELVSQMFSDTTALINLRQLRELDIRRNGLRTLQPDVFHFLPRLRVLRLEDNPWNCSDFSWFSDWITQHPEVILSEYPPCSYVKGEENNFLSVESLYSTVSTTPSYLVSQISTAWAATPKSKNESVKSKYISTPYLSVTKSPGKTKSFNISTLEILHVYKNNCQRDCNFHGNGTYHTNNHVKKMDSGEKGEYTITPQPQSDLNTKFAKGENTTPVKITIIPKQEFVIQSKINSTKNIQLTTPQPIYTITSHRLQMTTQLKEKLHTFKPVRKILHSSKSNSSKYSGTNKKIPVKATTIPTTRYNISNNNDTELANKTIETQSTIRPNSAMNKEVNNIFNISIDYLISDTTINSEMTLVEHSNATNIADTYTDNSEITTIGATDIDKVTTTRSNSSIKNNLLIQNVHRVETKSGNSTVKHLQNVQGELFSTSHDITQIEKNSEITEQELSTLSLQTTQLQKHLKSNSKISDRLSSKPSTEIYLNVNNYDADRVSHLISNTKLTAGQGNLMRHNLTNFSTEVSENNEKKVALFDSRIGFTKINKIHDNTDKDIFFQSHPGMFVLLGVAICMVGALVIAISHCAKRRKKFAVEYSRQQDIEVRSISSIGDIW